MVLWICYTTGQLQTSAVLLHCVFGLTKIWPSVKMKTGLVTVLYVMGNYVIPVWFNSNMSAHWFACGGKITPFPQYMPQRTIHFAWTCRCTFTHTPQCIAPGWKYQPSLLNTHMTHMMHIDLFTQPCSSLMTRSLIHPAVLKLVGEAAVRLEQHGGFHHTIIQVLPTILEPIWERGGC